MGSMDLTPPEVTIEDDVGNTQSITVSVTADGVAVDLTAWTIVGAIYTKQGGTLVQSYAVTAGATRTLTVTAAQSTTMGAGKRWYVVTGTDATGNVQTLAHGPHYLKAP